MKIFVNTFLSCATLLCLLVNPTVGQEREDMGEVRVQGPYTVPSTMMAADARGRLILSVHRGSFRVNRDKPQLIRSLDSGRSWDVSTLDIGELAPEAREIRSLHIGPAGTAWIRTDHGDLLVSSDSAMTWSLAVPGNDDRGLQWNWTPAANDEYLVYPSTWWTKNTAPYTVHVWSGRSASWTEHRLPSRGRFLWLDTLLVMQVYDNEAKKGAIVATPDLGQTLYEVPLGSPFQSGIADDGFEVWNGGLVVFDDTSTRISADLGATWRSVTTELAEAGSISWKTTDGTYLYGYRGDTLYRYGKGELDRFPGSSMPGFISASPLTVGGRILARTQYGVATYDEENGWLQSGGIPGSFTILADERRLWGRTLQNFMRQLDGGRGFAVVQPVLSTQSGLSPFAVVPQSDTLIVGREATLLLSPDGGVTWSEPYGVDDDVPALREMWATKELLYATRKDSRDRVTVLLHSTDRGQTWDSVRIGDRTGYQLTLGHGPASDPNALYMVEQSHTGYSLYIHTSADAGRTWQLLDHLEFDSTTDVDRSPDPVLTYGSHHLLYRVGSEAWIALSAEGVDTVIYRDTGYYDVYGMTRHNDLYIGLVDRPGVNIWDTRSRFRGRFLWRRVGEDTWHEHDTSPPGDSIPVAEGSFVSRANFHSTSEHLYAITQAGELWELGAIPGDTYGRRRLTVREGYGSGLYEIGDTVTVSARVLAEFEAFARWQNDSGADPGLTPKREWRASLVMPDRDLSVTGLYDTLVTPLWQTHTVPIAGTDSMQVVLAAAKGESKGIILMFGSGDRSAEDHFRSLEVDYFIRDAVKRNYDVASISSAAYHFAEDQRNDTLTWNVDFTDFESNYDRVRSQKVIEYLQDRSSGALPLYPVASDDAGTFVTLLARIERSPAVAYVGAEADRWAYTHLTSPAAIFDALFYEARVYYGTQMSEFNGVHRWNGFETLYRLYRGREIDWRTFARIDGIDSTTGAAIIAELKENYYLRPRNLNSSQDIRKAWDKFDSISQRPEFPTLRGLSDRQRAIVWELLITGNGYERFFSDYNETLLDFFDTHTEPALPSSIDEDNRSRNEVDLNLTFTSSEREESPRSGERGLPLVPDSATTQQGNR